MKKLALAMAVIAMLFAINVSGCCFGEPQEGQICFIIIPIPGADSGSVGTGFTVEQVDCTQVQ